jgi:hypothetical protein
MRKIQIFLLLIVLIMPLSGCFGGSDEADEITETTVINHYHYNNTTIIHETNESSNDEDSANDIHTHYNNSTYVDNFFTNNSYVDNYYTNNSNYTNHSQLTTVVYSQGGFWNGGPAPFNLSTSEGELVQILEVRYTPLGGDSRSFNIDTDCGPTPANPNWQIVFETSLENLPVYLPASSMNCTHTNIISSTGSWSIAYSIQSTTVI